MIFGRIIAAVARRRRCCRQHSASGQHRWHFLCSRFIFRFASRFRCVAPLFHHHRRLFFVRLFFLSHFPSDLPPVGLSASRSLAARRSPLADSYFRLASATHFATGRTVHIGKFIDSAVAAVHRHLITSIRTDNHTFAERLESVAAAPNTL